MYKNGFGINNLQWLMCHKTKANQSINEDYRIIFISYNEFIKSAF